MTSLKLAFKSWGQSAKLKPYYRKENIIMTKTYDLCVKTGSYITSNGENKNSYENIGVMLENENGPFILLKSSFNPAGIKREDGRSSILVSLFAPKEKESNTTAQEERTIAFDEQHEVLTEAIPF